MKNKRKEVGGETDREVERERERGERERERGTMNPAPTERNNSTPNFKAEVSESASGSTQFNTPLRLCADAEQTRTCSHYESRGYQASPLFSSLLFTPTCSLFHSHTASLVISPSHYELYTVCCSAAKRPPFPHRWLFLGSWKIGCYCPVLFGCFSPSSSSCQRWGGGSYTRRPTNKCLLSKALQMHLSELKHLWIIYGGGGQLYCNRSRQGARREEDKETESDTQAHSHKEEEAFTREQAHARAANKSKYH